MGWVSGSELADKIYRLFDEYDLIEDLVKDNAMDEFAQEFVKIFEEADCDTMDETLWAEYVKEVCPDCEETECWGDCEDDFEYDEDEDEDCCGNCEDCNCEDDLPDGGETFGRPNLTCEDVGCNCVEEQKKKEDEEFLDGIEDDLIELYSDIDTKDLLVDIETIFDNAKDEALELIENFSEEIKDRVSDIREAINDKLIDMEDE